MTLLSEIGIILSLVLGCLLLALFAELYYLLCWKNHKFSSSNYSNYTKEMLYFFCGSKPIANSSTPNPNPDLEMGHGSPNDLVLKGLGDEDVEAEIMRLHNLAGPPRFLFTIKEETKEDLEFDRSRKGSRTKSLSDLILALDSPINSGYNNNVTPVPMAVPVPQKGLVNDRVNEGRMYADNYNNPLFESSKEAELFRLRSSPPPKFKFLRDAEEKLYRKLIEEAQKSVVLQEGILNNSQSHHKSRIDEGKDVSLVKSEGIVIDDCSFQVPPLVSSPVGDSTLSSSIPSLH